MGGTLCPVNKTGQFSHQCDEDGALAMCDSHGNHTVKSTKGQGQEKLKNSMVESAFNLSLNFTQSKMYLFFKRLSMFFCYVQRNVFRAKRVAQRHHSVANPGNAAPVPHGRKTGVCLCVVGYNSSPDLPFGILIMSLNKPSGFPW